MTILDTNVVIERVKRKEKIEEDITALTLVEFPKVVSYERFYGNIVKRKTSSSPVRFG